MLNPATQHEIYRKLGGKGGTECLNTRLPLPTMLYAGYSVKGDVFFGIDRKFDNIQHPHCSEIVVFSSLLSKLISIREYLVIGSFTAIVI